MNLRFLRPFCCLLGWLSLSGALAQQTTAPESVADSLPYRYDLIIKVNPDRVLPGLIAYESDAVINYRTPSGAAASVNKTDVVVVIYRTGLSQFVTPPDEAAAVLSRVLPQTEQYANPNYKAPAPNPAADDTPLADPAPLADPTLTPKSGDYRPSLTDAQYQVYRRKGLNRVNEFAQYLTVITNKDLSPDEKDKAIEQATKLFLPDATIGVTSATRPGVKQYKVKDYLARLKFLPYRSTKIAWSEVSYVRELTQEADGNYYGMISGQQTFTGYGADGQKILYSDVTRKNVRVKLESYKKLVEGRQQQNWEIYLGNIGVAVE